MSHFFEHYCPGCYICLLEGDNIDGVLCARTQPAKLMQSIVSCAQLEDAVEEERLHLSSVEVDVEDVESFKSQLKGLYDKILFVINTLAIVHNKPLPSSRQHLSSGDCLEDMKEDYQNCSVLYCVTQLCIVISTLISWPCTSDFCHAILLWQASGLWDSTVAAVVGSPFRSSWIVSIIASF